jgi:cytochrome c-type biogenesis protein CcmE
MTLVNKSGSNKIKLWIGALLFLVAVVILVISVTQSTAEFYMTVDEVLAAPEEVEGANLRISGAVVGDTIYYDQVTGFLTFMIAHIPDDEALVDAKEGELTDILHQAVNDPTASRIEVYYEGPPPDMLKDEAQAILTGQLQPDGTFLARELLLKCPSKYEEALPDQVEVDSL